MSADRKTKAVLTKTINDVVVVKDTAGKTKSRCHQGVLEYFEGDSTTPYAVLDCLYLESADGETLPIVQSNEPEKFRKYKQAVRSNDFSLFGFTDEQQDKFFGTVKPVESPVIIGADESTSQPQ